MILAKNFRESELLWLILNSEKKFFFLVENEEYINQIESKRHGSHKDVTNLKSLFKKLKFKILYKKNLTKKNFCEELNYFSDNPEHKSGDMMILGDNSIL